MLYLGSIDSVGYKRLVKHGQQHLFPTQHYTEFSCMLAAGGEFKILTWYPMVPYMKIRIINNANKPFEKFSAYVKNVNNFLNELYVEEISV
jgi:hypothetical protein